MSRPVRVLVIGLALVPAVALAAGPQALNLKTGVPAELLGKTLGIARWLFPLSLAIALVLEAFGGSPSQSKNYGSVVWRALVVVALLASYPKVFGTVITTCEAVAARIAPQEIWERFAEHNVKTLRAFNDRVQAAPEDGLASRLENGTNFWASFLGGSLFDTLVMVFVLVGQAFQWTFGQLARILLALFYILGPLALVFHIPGPSRTAGRWFTAFVTIASWPILSSTLLAIATSLLYRTNDDALTGELGTAFGAVVSALLMVLLNLAVPLLASALVGGGVRNVIASSVGGAVLGAMAGTRLGAAGLKAFGRSLDGSASSAVAGARSPGPAQHSGGAADFPAPSADVHAQVPPSGPGAAPSAHPYPAGSISAPPPLLQEPSAPYQPAAPVPLRPLREPELPPTSPGHPFDPRKDNGWGDICHLRPVGGAPQVQAPTPDKRTSQPPDAGLTRRERHHRPPPTES